MNTASTICKRQAINLLENSVAFFGAFAFQLHYIMQACLLHSAATNALQSVLQINLSLKTQTETGEKKNSAPSVW
jgi:hypothetical protein